MQYGTGLSVILLLLSFWGYMSWFYTAATCTDGRQNGDERGVDCGGSCSYICAIDVSPLKVDWARSFEVTSGVYNAVAYVENINASAAAPEVAYTFSLYDDQGLITSVEDTTFLPPNSVYPVFAGRIATGGRVPTKTFLDLKPVEKWTTAVSSRDQFTVKDRELSDADVKPKLTATLVNNGLTSLYNVEVVATIFNSEGTALTASRTLVDKFDPRAEQQVVFTWPEPIAKTIRSCEVPTDVVMAIDLSGSMNNDGGTPPEPINSVLQAADRFVERLQTHDQAAVVTFATDAVIAKSFTAPTTAASVVRGLAIDPKEERGNTNTGDAFKRAAELFAGSGKNADARKVMVILTDGLATAPDEDPEGYALQAANVLKESGVEVYAIGLGKQVNMDFIRKIASAGDAYQALTKEQVDAIYQSITGAICEDGAAIIEIVPKIPIGQ